MSRMPSEKPSPSKRHTSKMPLSKMPSSRIPHSMMSEASQAPAFEDEDEDEYTNSGIIKFEADNTRLATRIPSRTPSKTSSIMPSSRAPIYMSSLKPFPSKAGTTRVEADTSRAPTLKPFPSKAGSTACIEADTSHAPTLKPFTSKAGTTRIEADSSRFESIRPVSHLPSMKAFTTRQPSILVSEHGIEMAERQSHFEDLNESEQEEQEEWAKSQIKKLGACPEGYDWKRKANGYQCERGGHGITDQLLTEGLGGLLVFKQKNREERNAAWGLGGEGATEGPFYPHPDPKRNGEFVDPNKRGAKPLKLKDIR